MPCRQRATVSKRCESQVLIHQTPASTNIVVLIAWHGACSLVLVLFRDYGEYLLVSLEQFCSFVCNYDNTRICITFKSFQEHRAHMVGPCTLRLSWFGSGSHMHIAQFVIAMLATFLELKIQLSHARDWAPLLSTRPQHTYSWVNNAETQIGGFSSHFCTSVSALPFLYFGFRTSVSALQRFAFAKIYTVEMEN